MAVSKDAPAARKEPACAAAQPPRTQFFGSIIDVTTGGVRDILYSSCQAQK
jgi:hypothetical protein